MSLCLEVTQRGTGERNPAGPRKLRDGAPSRPGPGARDDTHQNAYGLATNWRERVEGSVRTCPRMAGATGKGRRSSSTGHPEPPEKGGHPRKSGMKGADGKNPGNCIVGQSTFPASISPMARRGPTAQPPLPSARKVPARSPASHFLVDNGIRQGQTRPSAKAHGSACGHPRAGRKGSTAKLLFLRLSCDDRPIIRTPGPSEGCRSGPGRDPQFPDGRRRKVIAVFFQCWWRFLHAFL